VASYDTLWGAAAVAAAVAAVVWWYRDRARIPQAIADLARHLDGEVIPPARRGERSTIRGTYEGRSIELTFPVRFGPSEAQELRMRFWAPADVDCTLRRRRALEDLRRLGSEPILEEMSRRRVEYLFSTLDASDFVVGGGLAEIGVQWPWRAMYLAPERAMLPIGQAHALLQQVLRLRVA
jgi:hypothetical protein